MLSSPPLPPPPLKICLEVQYPSFPQQKRRCTLWARIWFDEYIKSWQNGPTRQNKIQQQYQTITIWRWKTTEISKNCHNSCNYQKTKKLKKEIIDSNILLSLTISNKKGTVTVKSWQDSDSVTFMGDKLTLTKTLSQLYSYISLYSYIYRRKMASKQNNNSQWARPNNMFFIIISTITN